MGMLGRIGLKTEVKLLLLVY